MKRALLVVLFCLLFASSALAADVFPSRLAAYEDKSAVLEALESNRAMFNEVYQKSFENETLVIQTERAFRLQLLDAMGPRDLQDWFLDQPAFIFPFENPNGFIGGILLARGQSVEAFEAQAIRHKKSAAYISSQRENVRKSEGKWQFVATSNDIDQAIMRALESPESFHAFLGKFDITGPVERAEVFMGTFGTGLWVVSEGDAMVIAKPSGVLLCYTAEEYTDWLAKCWAQVEPEDGAGDQPMTLLERMRSVAATPFGKGLYVIGAIILLWLLNSVLSRSRRKKEKQQYAWITRYNRVPEHSDKYASSARTYSERRQAFDARKRPLTRHGEADRETPNLRP